MSTQRRGNPADSILSFFKKHHPAGNAGVLVALSGGADSTALLLALLESSASDLQLQLVAAYVDHNLRRRDELDREIAHVTSLCSAVGVALEVRTIERGAIEDAARRDGVGIEAAARRIRYSVLESVRRDYGLEFIATGHHSDDQAETVLMRVLQGASAGGLSGMPERRGRIIRPLLSVSREDLRTFLIERKVEWIEDSSNRSERMLRNAIRRTVIPAIESVFPSYRDSLQALAEKASFSDEYLQREADKEIRWVRTSGGYRTELAPFLRANPAIRLSSLYRVANLLASNHDNTFPQRIPYRFLRPILFASMPVMNNRGLLLRGYGLVLRIEGENLFWEADVVEDRKSGYLLCVPERGTAEWMVGNHTLKVERYSGQSPYGEGARAFPGALVPASLIRPPLVIRSRRPGDAISTSSGTKSVKKILSDLGISAVQRDDVPIIVDREGIIAVLAAPFGGKTIISRRVPPQVPGSPVPATAIVLR